VLRRFDAEAVLAAVDRWRAASSVMVPTHFVRLLALPEEVKARYDVSSLRLVAHTGSACPADVKRAMIDWWGPIFSRPTGPPRSGRWPRSARRSGCSTPGSVGRAVPPFEALVVDDEGVPVPAGNRGQALLPRHHRPWGSYHGNPDGSAAAHLEPGVFTLGEIGYVDARATCTSPTGSPTWSCRAA
jgi:long-chain acyl-CoA synthetase